MSRADKILSLAVILALGGSFAQSFEFLPVATVSSVLAVGFFLYWLFGDHHDR